MRESLQLAIALVVLGACQAIPFDGTSNENEHTRDVTISELIDNEIPSYDSSTENLGTETPTTGLPPFPNPFTDSYSDENNTQPYESAPVFFSNLIRQDDADVDDEDDEPGSRASATFSDTCSCGEKLSGTRIVGGKPTEVNEYPWQAGIISVGGTLPFCGGSLITNKHVLTAAHCVDGTSSSEIKVLLREHNLHVPSESELITRGVSRIKVHRRYDSSNQLNDIAILTLASAVPISPTLLPVCLPSSKSTTFAKRMATVTGWGTTESGGAQSEVLQEVEVPVLSNRDCKTKTNYSPTSIFGRMLCAGARGIDSCQGDSGGPLIVKDSQGSYDQIGIVSWGISCAEAGYPGVYTRVNKFLKWIKNSTKGGVYCKGFSFP